MGLFDEKPALQARLESSWLGAENIRGLTGWNVSTYLAC